MAKRNVVNTPSPGADDSQGNRPIGPSDSSDSGSDLAGLGRSDDSDRSGTGERVTAGDESEIRGADKDIGVDRVVKAEEAGLGGGLDQAEEANAGITDEEIAEQARRRR